MQEGAFCKTILLSCIGALAGLSALPRQTWFEGAKNPGTSAIHASVTAASGPEASARPMAVSRGHRASVGEPAAMPLSPRKPSPTGGGSAGNVAAVGMVVARDPETGELGMPSPEQMRALKASRAEILRVSQDGFIEIHRPDGAVGLELNGRLQSYSVARIGPDGRISHRCVSSMGDAQAAAEAPATALEDR